MKLEYVHPITIPLSFKSNSKLDLRVVADVDVYAEESVNEGLVLSNNLATATACIFFLFVEVPRS